MTADPIALDLQRGRLSQTCPDCRRDEAAHAYCSWCFRPMGGTDWYRNGNAAERLARMPATAPVNPPNEYRHSAGHWPSNWGPFPGRQKLPRQGLTPLVGGSNVPDGASRLRAAS